MKQLGQKTAENRKKHSISHPKWLLSGKAQVKIRTAPLKIERGGKSYVNTCIHRTYCR